MRSRKTTDGPIRQTALDVGSKPTGRFLRSQITSAALWGLRDHGQEHIRKGLCPENKIGLMLGEVSRQPGASHSRGLFHEQS